MEAQELRIGNFIAYEPTIDDWEEIYVKPGTIIQCEISPDSFEPIPLTEKWLINFGFIHAKFSSEYWSHWVLKNGWSISLSNHTEESSGVNKGLFYWGDDYIEIKYVHQLQNLYFALTGEELVVKE